MGNGIHFYSLHFGFIMIIFLKSTFSCFVKMARSAKKEKKLEKKRKTKIIKDIKGDSVENNSVDAKKRNVRASSGIEGRGKNIVNTKIGEL